MDNSAIWAATFGEWHFCLFMSPNNLAGQESVQIVSRKDKGIPSWSLLSVVNH